MDNIQLTSKTPFRLLDEVIAAFVKEYKDMIKEHGASYAANHALAELLRSKGQKIGELKSPKDRIVNGQKRRWRAVKKTRREIERAAQERRERRAKAEKARRARKKGEAVEVVEKPEDNENV